MVRFLSVALIVTLALAGCPAHNKRNKMTDASSRKVQSAPSDKASSRKVQPAPPKRVNDAPKTPWSVDYSDGSGNRFRFWQASSGEAQYTYEPVTKQRSSSGTYSGGKPASGTLDPKQVRALWRQLRHMEGDASQHSATRKMGSGSFAFQSPDGKGKFIMERDGLDQLEALIKPLRSK